MKSWRYPNISGSPDQKLRKPELKARVSLLDEQHPESSLNKSQFRGFFNLAMMFGMIFLFTKPTLNFFNSGHFFELTLLNTFKQDFLLCLSVWPLFYTWSYTSFVLQLLIIKGLPRVVATVLQHLSQTGLFAFSAYIIVSKDWCATHSAFVILQAAVHFMKMHSYSTTNRDYREQAQQQPEHKLTSYPDNVNLWNFSTYMWTPTLVYDEKYPRILTRNWRYIVIKSLIALFGIIAAYIIYTDYVLIYIHKGQEISFFELLFRSIIPNTIIEILLFYVVFQNMTNVFAELTLFADRQFYDDWWNSTTYEEFNRLWNKPVHNFLYRHIYLQTILRYGQSKQVAQFITFAFSAALHETLFVMVFKVIRPIFLGFIIGQIPLFYLTKWMRGTKGGSYLFWFGLTLGPTLIICCYLRIDQNVTGKFALLNAQEL